MQATQVEQPKIETKVVNAFRASMPPQKFDQDRAYKEMQDIVDKKLSKKTYDSEEASKMAKELADEVRAKVRLLAAQRFKICVAATVVSQKGQGLRHVTRAFCDPETDCEVTYTFQSDQLIAVVTLYAIYNY